MGKQYKTAFTIIEVVLVLAIAGLIFLAIFIALPALQRSQRDLQRKRDASIILSKLTTFRANNQGRMPTATSDECGSATSRPACYSHFEREHIRSTDELIDPSSGEHYQVVLWDGDKNFGYIQWRLDRSPAGTYNYSLNTGCDGSNLRGENGMRTRGWHWARGKATIWMKLETGYYCLEEG